MQITDFISRDDLLKYLKSIKPELKKDGIKTLGLFGSFARGDASFSSDVDIIIETDNLFLKKYPAFKAFSKLQEIRENISNQFGGIKVDICDLSGLDNNKIPKEVIYV